MTEKHEAIQQIEQSVAMVNQMFLDMALLTEEQGIQLDRIEKHAKEAVECIDHGNDNIKSSIEYSKKIRKKRM